RRLAQLADARLNLGVALSRAGRRRDSERVTRLAIAGLRELAVAHPQESYYPYLLGGALSNQALARQGLGDPAGALRLVQEAIKFQEQALRLAPRSAQCRQFLRNHLATLCLILSKLGRTQDAVAPTRQALALAERLAEDFPHVPAYQADLA